MPPTRFALPTAIATVCACVLSACQSDPPANGRPVDASLQKAPPAFPPGSDDAEPADWPTLMERIDATCERIGDALQQRPPADLEATARRARTAAGWLRLGYGRLEQAAIPGFADKAHAAESWLLQVAIEADQGNGDIAADLWRTGRDRHCNDCHDAYERTRR